MNLVCVQRRLSASVLPEKVVHWAVAVPKLIAGAGSYRARYVIFRRSCGIIEPEPLGYIRGECR